jgi:hypothetical protein
MHVVLCRYSGYLFDFSSGNRSIQSHIHAKITLLDELRRWIFADQSVAESCPQQTSWPMLANVGHSNA